MTVHVPAWLVSLLIILGLVGGGGVAGATGYRYGPYAKLERDLLAARDAITTKETTIKSLIDASVEMRKTLAQQSDQIANLNKHIMDLRGEKLDVQGRLEQTEREKQLARDQAETRARQLEQVQRLKQAAETDAQQQRGIVLSKERDIYVLRTCLGGVILSMDRSLKRDYNAALYYLQAVERECRAAAALY